MSNPTVNVAVSFTCLPAESGALLWGWSLSLGLPCRAGSDPVAVLHLPWHCCSSRCAGVPEAREGRGGWDSRAAMGSANPLSWLSSWAVLSPAPSSRAAAGARTPLKGERPGGGRGGGRGAHHAPAKQLKCCNFTLQLTVQELLHPPVPWPRAGPGCHRHSRCSCISVCSVWETFLLQTGQCVYNHLSKAQLALSYFRLLDGEDFWAPTVFQVRLLGHLYLHSAAQLSEEQR